MATRAGGGERARWQLTQRGVGEVGQQMRWGTTKRAVGIGRAHGVKARR